MSLILRSRSDILSLPDQGFVGENAAIRILLQVEPYVRRLDIAHNNIGPEGIQYLLRGFKNLRADLTRRLRASGGKGVWGLRMMNLAVNSVDDETFRAILEYAREDSHLVKLLLQGNNITFSRKIEGIILSLNSSHLTFLSLNENDLMTHSPDSIPKFFSHLSLPSLTKLHLSNCSLTAAAVEPICQYLASPRSRNLVILALNGNQLGAQGCRRIVDTVESHNFTIQSLGLLANDITGASIIDDPDGEEGDDGGIVNGTGEGMQGGRERDNRNMEERKQDEAILRYTVHERLPFLMERNQRYTERIQKAAIKTISAARIILRGRKLNTAEIAKDVIRSIGERESSTSESNRKFPILDLPTEIINLIIRHISQDPWSFSSEQFMRLLNHAEDPESCKTWNGVYQNKVKEYTDGLLDQDVEINEEVIGEWLRFGKWDKWELERPKEELKGDDPKDKGVWYSLS